MTIASELKNLEKELWEANREGDEGFYRRVVRDDGLSVSTHGALGKADIIKAVAKNVNQFLSTDLSHMKVLQLTEGSAVVTYKATVTALVDDEKQKYEVLATSVYAREGDEWRSVLHQQTEL
jgi:hypothetical protein